MNQWKDCLKKGLAEKVTKDFKKANSLKRIARGRINFFKNIKISSENINYIFEGLYTSLLEILHSLALKQGYKISNHLCLGHYIKEIIKKENLYRIFDDLRYKRNSIVYYGKEMDFEIAKQAIEKCKKLLKELPN